MPLESHLTVMNSPVALTSFTGIKGYCIFCGDSVKWGKKIEIAQEEQCGQTYPSSWSHHIFNNAVHKHQGTFLAYVSSSHWLMAESRQGPPAWLTAHQNWHLTESYESTHLKKWKKENSQHSVI